MSGAARALEWERAGAKGREAEESWCQRRSWFSLDLQKRESRGEGERNVVARDMCKAH